MNVPKNTRLNGCSSVGSVQNALVWEELKHAIRYAILGSNRARLEFLIAELQTILKAVVHRRLIKKGKKIIK